MHGKGRYLVGKYADAHKSLSQQVRLLGSTKALGSAKETLYHQLELLNFLKSGKEWPGFLKVIPKDEVDEFLETMEKLITQLGY